MYVRFANQGEFVTSFAVVWPGGGTDRTKVIPKYEETTIDLSIYKLPDGTGCWARAYITLGPNHDSEDGFTYNEQSQQTALYELYGTVFAPRFQYNGLDPK